MRKQVAGILNKWSVLIINILCVISILVLLVVYSNIYRVRIYNQNVGDIDNLNHASASIAESYFKSREQHLTDLARYIEYSQFTLEEALHYIYQSNSNVDEQYQLIGADATGYLVDLEKDGSYIPLDYTNKNYYELQSIFTTVATEEQTGANFAPEFTNIHDGIKCFAQYTQVKVVNEDGTEQWMTLMSVSESKNFINSIQLDGEYDGMSSVLIDGSGNYIISNADFKSDNFFQYLYVFNELTMDERNDIEEQILSTYEGNITYKNSAGDACVYSYVRINAPQWYCLSVVPISSFHNLAFDYEFTLIAIVILSVVFLVDVAWLRSMNRKLKGSMKQAMEANNAKTEFLSRMSHDIRTPMNAILGLSHLGKDETVDENARESFEKILSSANYLLSLLNDILDMSRLETGRVTFRDDVVEANSFFHELHQLVEPLLQERNLQVVYDNGIQGVGYVYCDKVRMQQVYLNLLSNAIKFSNPGGKIEWIVREVKQENGRVYFEVTIRDHGCGMSEEFMSRIFKPFEQETNQYSSEKPGTGLGLAICKNLINQLGGEITVESKLSKGTSFTVHMSHRIAEAPVEKSRNMAQEQFNLRGKRILLVEDNELNMEIAEKMLETQGIEVCRAENGQIALDLFMQSEVGYYNAILMDKRMPVMNGEEATKAIRALDREDALTTPIIAMTADVYDTDRELSIQSGMSAHLSKPVDPKALFQTLEGFIGGL
ncbi:MAG TPA: ATP-binding protein [Lachnospiraceae bacterium]|nr:ATP-binding protein [Lachnospiraceae bacterium]